MEDSWECLVCNGSGELLADPCPLCHDTERPANTLNNLDHCPSQQSWPRYYCDVCHKDLQSAACLEQHSIGRAHMRRLRAADGDPAASARAFRTSLDSITEDELFDGLAQGRFRNIVVCTGAGVSTEAGIPDFRSPGGLFEEIRQAFCERFPEVLQSPETLLSRHFAKRHPEIWHGEVEPWLRSWKFNDAKPASMHRFCAWLHRQGWLRRIYTQNVDGLHVRPELEIPSGLVVECHGALRDASIVLYGDDTPKQFECCCDEDFPCDNGSVDLLMFFGTSLQVALYQTWLRKVASGSCSIKKSLTVEQIVGHETAIRIFALALRQDLEECQPSVLQLPLASVDAKRCNCVRFGGTPGRAIVGNNCALSPL